MATLKSSFMSNFFLRVKLLINYFRLQPTTDIGCKFSVSVLHGFSFVLCQHARKKIVLRCFLGTNCSSGVYESTHVKFAKKKRTKRMKTGHWRPQYSPEFFNYCLHMALRSRSSPNSIDAKMIHSISQQLLQQHLGGGIVSLIES